MVMKVRRPVHNCDALNFHGWTKDKEPCQKLMSVRRNLFGFSEKEYTTEILDKQLTDMAEKAAKEWNFDFIKELPQAGRYVWQKVRNDEVPFWYVEVKRPSSYKTASKRLHDDDDSSESINEMLPICEEVRLTETAHIKDKKVEKFSNKKLRLVQTSMKDYTRVQKRRSSCRLKLKQLQLCSNRLRNHHLITDRYAI